MPRNQRGKNQKWSKHKEKEHGVSKMERITELAAKRGVEVWEIDPNELSENDSESSESLEEVEEHKYAPGEDSEEEEVKKGHQNLIETANPNRARKAPSKQKQQQQETKPKAPSKHQMDADMKRLAEVRARREAAAKEREENRVKAQENKKLAESKFKKK